MTKYVYALFLALMFSCTNSDRARRTLEDQGFTNVTLTGYSFSCAGHDSTCTGFTAMSPFVGRNVSGAVGCGYGGCSFKGCTIRFD